LLLREAGLPTDGLREHLASGIVARDGSRIVANAALEIYGDGALLRSVAVAQEMRGTGLGRAIVEAALGHGRERGIRTFYLLTVSAKDFFEHLGFAEIARGGVPASVQESIGFTIHCCGSATVMKR
jgi:amino-acid N-acetyltransferase